MDCIRGDTSGAASDTTATIWCSGAWNYSYTTLAATANNYPTQFAQTTATNSGYTFNGTGGNNAIDVNGTTPNQGDLGSCCYTYASINTLVNQAVNTATGTGTLFN